MSRSILTITEYEEVLSSHPACLAYFSGAKCGVCHALLPKIHSFIKQEFPKLHFIEISTDQCPEISAQLRVFSVPTVIIYFEGKENKRFSRSFSLLELRNTIARPYELIFS